MKKLIIILLCIQFFALSAVDGDQLDLGNVVIQGETESLEDTLSSDRNLEEYCIISSTEQFEYTAYYSPMIIEQPITYPAQKVSAIQFKGGMENFTGVQGVISFGDIWNFSADLFNRERADNWKESTYSLQWQPEINEHKMLIDFSNKEFTHNTDETKITGGYVSYIKENLVISQIPKISWNINLKSAYNKFTQLQVSATDFDINSKIGIKYNNLIGNVSINLLKQKVSGYFDVGTSNLNLFERLGLWCVFDENRIYPSIYFNSKISLFKNLAIRLENNPTISTNSRIDDFNENLLQNILQVNDSQTKKILNPYAAIESDFILPLSLYYNASLERDHIIYVEDANGFYEQKDINCLIHKMGLKAAYKYGDLSIAQNFEYTLSEEVLYFEPSLVTSTKLELNKNLFRIGIDLQFLSGRVDDNEIDLDDAFIVDAFAIYSLRDNISILAEAKNVFSQKYKKYNNYTAKELQIIIGVKMTF